MGFSLSAATAIIGVSILISIEIIISTTIPTITNVHDSYDEMRDRSIDRFQTDINITSVLTSVNGSNYDLNVSLENTGSITLVTQDFNILINGVDKEFSSTSNHLYPQNEVYFNIFNIAGSGANRLKIITNNGISDYYNYNT